MVHMHHKNLSAGWCNCIILYIWSFSPLILHPTLFPNIKHLYFPLSHLTLVQGQTELPAAPLSFASMPVRLQSVCFFFFFLYYFPHLPQKNCLQFMHVHNTLFSDDNDDDVLLGVLCSSWAEYEDPLFAAQGDSCNLLSLLLQVSSF